MNDTEKEAYLSYLRNRRSSHKVNYYQESLKEIASYRRAYPGKRPSILLHACCIVCACWPLDFLKENGFDVTVIYNNSNIWPKEEYDHRLQELQRYIKERWQEQIPVIVPPYDYEEYASRVLPQRGTDPEGWTSCFGCYGERMDSAFHYANENGFDWFATVMTFSRQKDSQKINEIGLSLGKKYAHTKYFASDFKKADGALKSDRICNEYCIYRQDYCGCEYSFQERHQQVK
ncbi:MAG: epoxyqueuosine reductase QueH [Erysipelotrichaceae bacterium]|jgi:predicted adenine nucleotide alpha hydrolase (AANH) superfamily ATPase|nr:epoxyqueuosine reductase QueH [Erysipelotrichaceae bacterium]